MLLIELPGLSVADLDVRRGEHKQVQPSRHDYDHHDDENPDKRSPAHVRLLTSLVQSSSGQDRPPVSPKGDPLLVCACGRYCYQATVEPTPTRPIERNELVAQRCKACTHPESRALDAELLLGIASVAELVERFRLTDSSIRRHRQNHLATTVLLGRRVGENLGVGFLLEELLQIMIDAQQVRRSASLAGRGDLVLKAGAQSRATIEVLLSRLNIDDASVVEQFSAQEALARHTFELVRQVPQVGRELAARLAAAGHQDLATDLAEVAETAALAIEPKGTS